jgi:hypothetical protein
VWRTTLNGCFFVTVAGRVSLVAHQEYLALQPTVHTQKSLQLQVQTPLPPERHIIRQPELETLELSPLWTNYPNGAPIDSQFSSYNQSVVRLRCNSDGYIDDSDSTPRMECEVTS